MALENGSAELILDHHQGIDDYSDGDVENDILDYVARSQDQDKMPNDDRWAVLYHLSPKRENLLEWYDFDKDASLLEVGAGCGALTGLFCRKVKEVTAIELSARRARIIASRHRSANNLKVYAGKVQDIPLTRSYDYATLIGVLEYAGSYQGTKDPYLDLLVEVRELLKKDGTLIMALENRLGLKYWAGACEDHSGRTFEGIEGYVGSTTHRTFGRTELKGLLEAAGFKKIDFYYPVPDYKLPDAIFSDHRLPRLGEMVGRSPNFDQPRFEVFREDLAFDGLILNDGFAQFANSFLVFCRG